MHLEKRKHSLAVYAGAIFACALLFIPLFYFQPLRVGDGSEYYALFLAIRENSHTWMTTFSWKLYEDLIASNSIRALIPLDPFQDFFPALKLGATADFNHFWVYSLISAGLSKGLSLFGIHAGIHQSFLIQHALLFMAAILVAVRASGQRGFYAAILLTLSSPIIWFADKVHTEFFTYCLVLCCVILVQKRSFMWGALCLSIASTQNPSFALLAFALLVFRLIEWRRRPFDFLELGALVATCIIVLMHPAYYYFRFGVLTPQMLAGGAKIGVNLSLFYVWLIDPDVGLLPNWPAGLVLIGSGIYYLRKKYWLRPNGALLLFVLLYLAVNLFAQSSTTNINSGATPGLARYALWYIPLFYPLMLGLVDRVAVAPIIWRVVAGGLFVVYLAANVWAYDPRQGERYETPSPVSSFVQRHLSWLYNPPAEVFAERFSRQGENATQVYAVLGPSCEKVLVIPGNDPSQIAQSSECLLDPEKLRAAIAKIPPAVKDAHYIHLGNAVKEMRLAAPAEYQTRASQSGAQLLGQGWHSPESWGVWAADTSGKLKVPCLAAENFKVRLTLVALEVPGQAPSVAKVRVGGDTLWAGALRGAPTDVVIELKKSACQMETQVAMISLEVERLHSASSFSQSKDTRNLGIGLIGLSYP